MKDFNEITSHVLAIDKADDEKAISFYERKKNIEALACKVADELIAGRPVPVFNQVESVTRIDGLLPQLANELVSQHAMAIAHRTHLAERLEADGGENGAKAAAILRGMNPVADSKAALLRARRENFTGHQPRGEASDEVEAPAREPFWVEDIEEADIQQGDIVEYHGVNRWSVLCRSDIRTPDGTPSGRVQLQLQLLDGPIHATECVYLPLPGEPRVMRPVEAATEADRALAKSLEENDTILTSESVRQEEIRAAELRGRLYGFRRARAEALASVVSESIKLDFEDRGPLRKAADAIFSMKEEA